MNIEIEGYFDKNPDKDWLNPVNRSIVRDAVMERATSVTLDDGLVFNLRYGIMRTSLAENGEYESVQLTRVDGGFTPVALLSIPKLLKFRMEND